MKNPLGLMTEICVTPKPRVVYLVCHIDKHEDAGDEYETQTAVAVFTFQEEAEALASRGGWIVQEMPLDQLFRDSWLCHLGFDGQEVQCIGPTPVLELPESKPDPWKTGCYGYGWTEEEARARAHAIYRSDVVDGYKKLKADIAKRRQELGK